jgi:NADPH:quinone reductase-like Zn-dependent oxidoreductase
MDLVIDGIDKSTTLSSAMISTACEPRSNVNGDMFSKSSLIIVRDDTSALQHSLASSIQSMGGESGLQITITDADSFHEAGGATCIFLQTMDQFSFQNPQESGYGVLKKIFRHVKNLLWVTRRGISSSDTLEQDAILGLSRSILSESEGLSIVTLGLEHADDAQRATQYIWTVLRHYFKTTSATPTHSRGEEIAEINGFLCVSRLLPARKLQNDIRRIQSQDNLVGFEQDSANNSIIGDDEIEIKVKTSGLRPQNLSCTSSQAADSSFGGEYAGIVTQVGQNGKNSFQVGNRVIAIMHNHNVTFKARIRCPTYLTCRIPDGMDFQEAVAMPLDFIAAYDALTNWAQLQKGESVLIQDGSGAPGQAVIQVALLAGADVFVAVPEEEDAERISDLYQIPISHVLCRYKGDFTTAAEIKQLTGGRGVDVVLNALASDRLPTLWGCVASYGRVIEIGNRDTYESSVGSLPLSHFQSPKRNVMFTSIDLTEIFQDPARTTALLCKMMDMIGNKKIVAPKPLHVYAASQVQDAFRNRDSKMPSGKIVVSFDLNNDISVLTKAKSPPFHANATYIITGGLGGLGKSITKWMVSHGARNLLLLSRRGGETSAAKPFLDELTTSGVTVLTPRCDIGDEKAVQGILQEVQNHMPPIKGCIQASMVLKVSRCPNTPKET